MTDIDKFSAAPTMKLLRDFQRRTVDHVFNRFYDAIDPTMRFLVADEVGLGKTMVARGLIARISVQTFDLWVRKGILPGPIPGTRRWSRSAIERRLAGGVVASSAIDQLSPFEQWKCGNAH
jgi:hypothetical protein